MTGLAPGGTGGSRTVRGRWPARWRPGPRSGGPADGPAGPPAETLGRLLRQLRQAGDPLRSGLSPAAAASAAGRLRTLLAAEGLGIWDLAGWAGWAGSGRPGPDHQAVAARAVHRRGAARSGPMHAYALLVDGEPVGGLLAVGDRVSPPLLSEVAGWLADQLQRAELAALRGRLEEAELRSLSAQISPHFVYNALAAIAALVRSDPARARDLLLDFADFTRYTLSAQGAYTTLAEEFRSIDAYLALERARFGERLQVSVRVAPEVLPVAVPVLVLQPLVENAVRHGLEPRADAGAILVTGEMLGDEVRIEVEDHGPGMEPRRAEELLAGRDAGGRVGLGNVDRRLRSVYGPAYGLIVDTAPDAGTKVIVRVPRFRPGVQAPGAPADR